MIRKRAYWIGGTAIALLGVALARLLAPELAGTAGTIALGSGCALVVAGITVISCAMRRKPSEAFITVDKPARRRKRP